MNSLILCKFPVLFSTVKFKLGFLRVGLRLYFQVVSSSQRGFAIFKCSYNWTSQFFPVYDKDGIFCLFVF